MTDQDKNELSEFNPSDFSMLQYARPEEMTNPFSREIFLLKVSVAGCGHVDGIEKYLPTLAVGKRLTLLREQDNPADKRAILVMDGDQKLGYIPRDKNSILSRLMDAGKYVYATVDDTLYDVDDPEYPWNALSISVFMQD